MIVSIKAVGGTRAMPLITSNWERYHFDAGGQTITYGAMLIRYRTRIQ